MRSIHVVASRDADSRMWADLSMILLVAAAQKSFTGQQIVLPHANLPTVTRCYEQRADLIRSLQTVTFSDVFC